MARALNPPADAPNNGEPPLLPAQRRKWALRLADEVRELANHRWAAFHDAGPLAKIRSASSLVLLFLGLCLFYAVTLPGYQRTVVITGRSEILTLRLNNADYGHLLLSSVQLRRNPDSTAQTGQVDLSLDRGTLIRFVRRGHGPLQLSFEAGPQTGQGACSPGENTIGRATIARTEQAVCDVSALAIPQPPAADPLVIALSGAVIVGEEVTEGAGTRPQLIEGAVSFLVRHATWPYSLLCRFHSFRHLCNRFVATTVNLPPGTSVEAPAATSASLGYIRIDPSDQGSGMTFSVSTEAPELRVSRVEGEAFTIRESPFDVIAKSPMLQTLNTMLVCAGLIWFLLRIGRKNTAGTDLGLLGLWLLIGLPSQGWAQQATLQAETDGQAMLRARGDRCYAISVKHVIGSETVATLVAPGRELGEANLLRTLPAVPEPVVLMSVRGLSPSVCPAFEPSAGLDDWLRIHSSVTLRVVRRDGSLAFIPLLLDAVEIETLTIQAPATPLAQGMSGATVLVADRPVGLLTDVTNEGRDGRVMRIDRIFERLAPHLAATVASAPVMSSINAARYEILRSTAEPVTPRNGLGCLSGEGPGPWRVTAAGRVELTLHTAEPITGFALDVTGLEDGPRTTELLGSRSPQGPWQSLGAFSLEPGDKVSTKLVPPTSFPYLLLRLYPAASTPTLSANRLTLIRA